MVLEIPALLAASCCLFAFCEILHLTVVLRLRVRLVGPEEKRVLLLQKSQKLAGELDTLLGFAEGRLLTADLRQKAMTRFRLQHGMRFTPDFPAFRGLPPLGVVPRTRDLFLEDAMV